MKVKKEKRNTAVHLVGAIICISCSICGYPYSLGVIVCTIVGSFVCILTVEENWHAEIAFHYEDCDGMTIDECVALPDRLTRKQKKEILSCLENGGFKPSLVGLPLRTFCSYADAGYPVCRIDAKDIRNVFGGNLSGGNAPGTLHISCSASSLVATFKWAKGHWEEDAEKR